VLGWGPDRAADEVLLRACTGATLDLGCGPGRFTAALAARGVRALGVDLAATAVAMTIRRGGMALHQDLFAPLPGFGSWAQVLLADGNIGIGGDPARVLRRARELLGVEGIVLAELDPPCTGVRREYLRLETEHAVANGFRGPGSVPTTPPTSPPLPGYVCSTSRTCRDGSSPRWTGHDPRAFRCCGGCGWRPPSRRASG